MRTLHQDKPTDDTTRSEAESAQCFLPLSRAHHLHIRVWLEHGLVARAPSLGGVALGLSLGLRKRALSDHHGRDFKGYVPLFNLAWHPQGIGPRNDLTSTFNHGKLAHLRMAVAAPLVLAEQFAAHVTPF